jgi:hypothetical protein
MKKTSIRAILMMLLLPMLALPGCKVQPAPALPTATRPAAMSWRVASAHLDDIFAKIPNSSIDDFRRETPEEERTLVNASHGEAGIKDNKAHIYGEPAPATTQQLLDLLAVDDTDALYDLGCGRGYVLMQALLTSPLRKAVGVELAASRVNAGKAARAMLLEQGLLPKGKTLELYEEDMVQTNLDQATLVFMDSVFFSDQLLLAVAKNMARARNLRKVVMIMKGLPPNPWFELERTERMKMSWSPKFGSDILFYHRTAVPAVP